MSNVLKVSLQTTIYSLSERGLVAATNCERLGDQSRTVGGYLRLAIPAISIIDTDEGAERKPAVSITGEQGDAKSNQPFRLPTFRPDEEASVKPWLRRLPLRSR